MTKGELVAVASFLLLLSFAVKGTFAANGYTVTVATDMQTYNFVASTVTVAGVVSAPNGSSVGPDTAVSVRVTNPSGSVVILLSAPVNDSTGSYAVQFVTGGTSSWVAGTYEVTVTWGAHPPTITNTTSFTYSPPVTSTTQVTSSSSSTSSSTTTSSASSSSSTTSSSTTSTHPSSSSAASTTHPPTSSSSSSSSGGIPEFTLQPVVAALVVLAIAGAYVFARRTAGRNPSPAPSQGSMGFP
jgi:hypothetical protein